MALLEVRDIRQAYDGRPMLDALSFELERGRDRLPARAERLRQDDGAALHRGLRTGVLGGEIVLHGETMSRPGLTVPAERRRIGMVFQDYALFPHLTVERNVGFGLHCACDRASATRASRELLEHRRATPGSRRRYPHELSGGQQQRVALARALAPRPELLLLDEPFSNLDVDMRERLSLEVRDILKQQKTTAILVTHDQHEAFNIADEIGIMRAGRIEQWDTPYRPLSPSRRRASSRTSSARACSCRARSLDDSTIGLELGVLARRIPHAMCRRGTAVDVLLRPDDILHDDSSPLQARVLHKAFRGAEFLYTLQLPGGGRVLSLVPSHHNHAVGETDRHPPRDRSRRGVSRVRLALTSHAAFLTLARAPRPPSRNSPSGCSA